jgi:hypothetical protein
MWCRRRMSQHVLPSGVCCVEFVVWYAPCYWPMLVTGRHNYCNFYWDVMPVVAVTHFYLENPVVATAMMSNATLDAAKTSRCVQVVQREASAEDLRNLCQVAPVRTLQPPTGAPRSRRASLP